MDTPIDPAMDEQPARRERIGSHAWVRTVGLVGSGLVAGSALPQPGLAEQVAPRGLSEVCDEYVVVDRRERGEPRPVRDTEPSPQISGPRGRSGVLGRARSGDRHRLRVRW